MANSNCETCTNYVYDEDCDAYVCLVNMDEDDFMRYVISGQNKCPFYTTFWKR